VRRDVLYGIWQTISRVVRRDLFVPFVRLNFGEQAVGLTPQLSPEFDDSADLVQTATRARDADPDQVPVPLGYARDLLGIPAPEEGEEVLEGAPAPAPVLPFPRLAAAAERPKANPPVRPKVPGRRSPSTTASASTRSAPTRTCGSCSPSSRASRPVPRRRGWSTNWRPIQLDALMRGIEDVRKRRAAG